MPFAGRMSKMKTRDLIARLNELQCVYVGQEGSHCKYKTPCGQSITFRCIKMNEELSLNVYSSVRRVLRAEGLDIDGSGYQQATCGDFVGAHRHVAGLAGDVVPFTRRLTKEQSEKRYIHDREEWFQAVTTPGSAVWAIFQTGPKVAAVIHEPATVRPDGRLSDYLIVRLEHGELHSVPTQTVAVRQTTEGRLLQFPRGGGLKGLPSGWVVPPGLAGLAGDLVPFRRMSMQQEIERNPSAWYAAVTTVGSPVWVEHNGKIYRGVVVTPSKAQGSKMRSMTRAAVEIEGSAVPHYIRPDKMAPRPGHEADVLPFRLGGLAGGSDVDYYGEARMALDEEARYQQERLAQMTPAEHRAEAAEARRMAAAMAQVAMRQADGKTARYYQNRVVFYNQQAADHERRALKKQRADEA